MGVADQLLYWKMSLLQNQDAEPCTLCPLHRRAHWHSSLTLINNIFIPSQALHSDLQILIYTHSQGVHINNGHFRETLQGTLCLWSSSHQYFNTVKIIESTSKKHCKFNSVTELIKNGKPYFSTEKAVQYINYLEKYLSNESYM